MVLVTWKDGKVKYAKKGKNDNLLKKYLNKKYFKYNTLNLYLNHFLSYVKYEKKKFKFKKTKNTKK